MRCKTTFNELTRVRPVICGKKGQKCVAGLPPGGRNATHFQVGRTKVAMTLRVMSAQHAESDGYYRTGLPPKALANIELPLTFGKPSFHCTEVNFVAGSRGRVASNESQPAFHRIAAAR